MTTNTKEVKLSELLSNAHFSGGSLFTAFSLHELSERAAKLEAENAELRVRLAKYEAINPSAWIITAKTHCTGITKDSEVAEYWNSQGFAIPLYIKPE